MLASARGGPHYRYFIVTKHTELVASERAYFAVVER